MKNLILILKTSFALLTLFSIIAMFGLSANAGEMKSFSALFREKIYSAQKICADLHCDQSIKLEDMSRIEAAKIPLKTSQRIELVAFDLAQIWGDTILEGDYAAHNDIFVDRIEKLTENGKQIGYRITYSAKAWDTSNCNYNSEDPETLKDCQEGRIIESGFASKNLLGFFRDENALAEFKEK